MEKEHFLELLEKYDKGLCSAEEKLVVETWFVNLKADTEDFKEEAEKSAGLIWTRLPFNARSIKEIGWPRSIAVMAAAIAVMLGIWTVFFVKAPDHPACDCDEDLQAGSNQAILTLANGTKINLNDAKNGTLLSQTGLQITKAADGTLIYKVSPTANSENDAEMNTVTTPKGGQYKIVLPDGSKVWLNAASSLSYTVSLKERGGARRINMSGEAYFEVKKDKEHPFIVVTATQEVTVLGTHFNVSSYSDEPSTQTTLLEGSVSIAGLQSQNVATVLHPGDQGINDGNQIKVRKVDTDEAVSWVKEEFMFRNEPLESIMRKVARWYNVELIYQNKQVGEETFGGTISRYDNISSVLSAIEATSDVKFKVVERKVFIR